MAPWIQLLKQLELLGAENAVLCRCGGTLPAELKRAGVTCFTYDPVAQWWPAIDRGYGHIVHDYAPDLLHTRLSSAAKIAGYWGKKYHIPVISTFDKYPKARYYRNSDVLIGCSSAVTAHIKTLRLPHARTVETILNPVLAQRYERDGNVRAAFRAERGVSDAEKIVLGMGRFVGWKAWDDYLRAIALVPAELPLRFWLVGGGDQESSLHKLARDLDIENRVEFFPYASDVRPWLWAADVFVQTSKEPEGFSLMLIEAMASGVVPIATNIGGTLDIVRDGENGFLIKPGDVQRLSELIQLCAVAPNLKAHAAAAVEGARRVNVENVAQQTYELYIRTTADFRRAKG